jgi:hypothetical protein
MREKKALKKFVKDRNEALLSLDRDKIVAYCRKYNVPIHENETVFWADVHKGIVAMDSATDEKKIESANWLIEHGFSPYIV